MANHCNICSFKCWGRDNHHASCCSIEDRNYIIGPILDYEKFLKDLSKKIGREVDFHEVFYNFETGSKAFPNKPIWQVEQSYPAFKVDLSRDEKYCINYNPHLRSCMVYDIRPETCRDYFCDYLERELLMNDLS
jgi:Fe-S-cluster containining protein